MRADPGDVAVVACVSNSTTRENVEMTAGATVKSINHHAVFPRSCSLRALVAIKMARIGRKRRTTRSTAGLVTWDVATVARRLAMIAHPTTETVQYSARS